MRVFICVRRRPHLLGRMNRGLCACARVHTSKIYLHLDACPAVINSLSFILPFPFVPFFHSCILSFPFVPIFHSFIFHSFVLPFHFVPFFSIHLFYHSIFFLFTYSTISFLSLSLFIHLFYYSLSFLFSRSLLYHSFIRFLFLIFFFNTLLYFYLNLMLFSSLTFISHFSPTLLIKDFFSFSFLLLDTFPTLILLFLLCSVCPTPLSVSLSLFLPLIPSLPFFLPPSCPLSLLIPLSLFLPSLSLLFSLSLCL
ncbi:unnamed protein product [Acanthosepion pharaonis]|uniref:Uncharacterized protein n=1 Tax=Acanthosepion pharaonis TaxID=158019 RepID=A0A812BH44_ACAPH|nr:unnamed protein product [Sepia pharaonis]